MNGGEVEGQLICRFMGVIARVVMQMGAWLFFGPMLIGIVAMGVVIVINCFELGQLGRTVRRRFTNN